MVTLIARKPHVYAGRRYKAGDRYRATRAHARLLTAIKHADYAPDEPPVSAPVIEAEPPKRTPRRRALRVEDPAPPVSAPVTDTWPSPDPIAEPILSEHTDPPQAED